jgi:hypothetical protein
VHRAPVLVALTAALVVLAGVTAASVRSGVDGLPPRYGVAFAEELLDEALDDVPVGRVHVDLHSPDRWPVATGVVHQLVQDGWSVGVDAGSAEIFGEQRVTDGDAPVEVVVVGTDDPDLDGLRADGLTDLGSVETEQGPTTFLLRVED